MRRRKRTTVITALAGLSGLLLSSLALVATQSASAQVQDLAAGRATSASSHTQTYISGNVTDGDPGTYWESANRSFPEWFQVDLGASATVTGLELRLPPGWEPRDQDVTVLGSADGASFAPILERDTYSFDPASGNTVDVDVPDTDTRFVRLRFEANTTWPAGQLSELRVLGVPGSPDTPADGANLADGRPASASSHTHTYVAGHATDGDTGTYWESGGGQYPATLTTGLATPAELTSVTVRLNPDPVWAQRTQTFAVLGRTGSGAFTTLVEPVQYTFSPSTGNVVTVPVTGTAQDVRLEFSANSGAPGAQVGELEVRGTPTDDPTDPPTGDPTDPPTDDPTDPPDLPDGRGADMPYRLLEAEDGTVGGGADLLGPNRTVGDLAGEASGRRAAHLDQNGAYVEWTLTEPTNTLVTRFSIPDAPGGGGQDGGVDIYVDGQFHKRLDLTSRYAWVYGNEASPVNNPSAGGPRHVYDEANTFLDETVPAGSTIRLQKTAANPLPVAVDFISTELVSPKANPDPARYVEPAGFTHQDVQNALDRARMDNGGEYDGVYLPAGDYTTSSKFQVYGEAVDIVGAGPWYTRFHAPQDQSNTDIGFRAEASANGSKFRSFSYWGNYVERIDGPGKVLDFNRVADMTVDDLWVEHMVCMFWAANMDDSTITNSRVRNTWADAINMTNGSAGNVVRNIETRGTGDDSFALFAATDAGGSGQSGNLYESLTSLVTWRAAGLAVYGGQNNTFRDILVADTLVYSGVTISSLDFGYPMEGFGPGPTVFEDISLIRTGGHFWGNQTFPAMWLFSASKEFRAIRVSDVDIVDPTYSGIMFQTNYVGGQPQHAVEDTVLTRVSISGARRSGDDWDAKSGFGIWANELPEPGQGPAVGSATFVDLTLANNAIDIRNETSTFTIDRQ
ncbi:discoidin domain-containing protein [Myceligenerans pegani]|uniref:Discoidin domain-containing protein n=1 Tax=Myceligenerans pegani TaxID=2776917 RepID=A0ABR9MVD4_9MICO|nr:discoidin domain-containing protein [Myceligenerans sp. TRM 65318]MBE1875340.1 discoidin domain-containing protein [Myceligenerans sp. TRM 65318]MBE3017611.1 discoidin domain-containing protein [Myceligenerans sp. TRM 65318]